MKNYYFTFGSGHHDIHGRSLMGYYVKIEAEDSMTARILMFDCFGAKWAFQYSEEKFLSQIAQYNLQELFIGGVELCCGIEQSEYLKLKEKRNVDSSRTN